MISYNLELCVIPSVQKGEIFQNPPKNIDFFSSWFAQLFDDSPTKLLPFVFCINSNLGNLLLASTMGTKFLPQASKFFLRNLFLKKFRMQSIFWIRNHEKGKTLFCKKTLVFFYEKPFLNPQTTSGSWTPP